jgi:hypothetical protein
MTSPGAWSRGWPLLLLFGPGCFEDRPRPAPFEPGDSALVSVELLRPVENTVVLAGRSIVVDVLARGEGQDLSGIGYVVRLVQGGGRIDSAALQLQPRPLIRDSFQFTIPAQMATNTHLSITGLAFPTSGRTRYSPAAQVVVAQCSPDIPACR